MAVVTRHFSVRALQGEICLQIVVKGPPIPGDGIVAGATLIVEIAAVRILVLMASDALRVCIAERLRLMAVLTFGFAVLAKQREWAQVMVEEDRILPIDFSVACLALSTQRLLVHVILKMAGITTGIERHFENRFNVAIDARRLEVTAEQFVIGIEVMIEVRLRPGATVVAGVALVAAVGIVLVIFEMTRYALHAHGVFEWILGVAVATGELGMSAKEVKVGIPDMIEARVMPVGRVVAAATLIAAAPVMCVIVGVTVNTLR